MDSILYTEITRMELTPEKFSKEDYLRVIKQIVELLEKQAEEIKNLKQNNW